jgi:hypothetical protein
VGLPADCNKLCIHSPPRVHTAHRCDACCHRSGARQPRKRTHRKHECQNKHPVLWSGVNNHVGQTRATHRNQLDRRVYPPQQRNHRNLVDARSVYTSRYLWHQQLWYFKVRVFMHLWRRVFNAERLLHVLWRRRLRFRQRRLLRYSRSRLPAMV